MTTPYELCSTVNGRALLEWYVQTEDYYCSMAGRKFLLPKTWRRVDVEIRQKLADQEYPRLLEKDRKPRILDDLYPQFWAMSSTLNEIYCKIHSLNKLDHDEAAEAAARLEEELQQHLDNIDNFLNSRYVLEILEPETDDTSPPRSYKHETCCLIPPFIPHRLQYPPAGVFRMCMYATKWYIYSVLYTVIRNIRNPNEPTGLRGRDATFCSNEICKTIAGIEDDIGEDPDGAIPLFTFLMLSARTCDVEYRKWIWYKLNHFEELGYFIFDAMKKYLAKLWNLPEIITIAFSNSPPSYVDRDLRCENMLAAVDTLDLDDND